MKLFVLSLVLHAVSAGNTAVSVRNDVWRSDLPESGCADPTNGRRLHVVLDNIAAGMSDAELGSVQINGQEGLSLDTSESADLKYFDWLRAHTNADTGSVWISFHTSNAQWAPFDSLLVHVAAKNGTVLYDGTLSGTAIESGLTLSYAAFRFGGTQAVLHVHNEADTPQSLGSLYLDGTAVPKFPNASVPPGGHLVIPVSISGIAKHTNDVWTVRMNGLGFGGRVAAGERFAVEAWPHSSDCSVPGGNDDHAQELQSYGIDSVYYTGGSYSKNCNGSLVDVVNQLAGDGTKQPDFHVVTDAQTAGAASLAARFVAIDAVLLGDEVDDKVDASHLRGKLAAAYAAHDVAPESPTYQGSKTTRNVGSFAGIADIQGSDAYCAACAPTMLPAISTLPLQYPFYYLRNARDNHAPGVFWGYSQLFSDAWSYQANANEIIAQIGQVVLSGSKALMFFQSYHEIFKASDMNDIAAAIQSVRAVGTIVREGDVAGIAFDTSSKLNKEVMIEVIRSPEQLLIAIVNTNGSGYNNALCHTGLSKHWKIGKHTIDSLDLDLSSAPDVSKLGNWQEAVNGKLVPLAGVTVSNAGRTVTLSGIDLDDTMTVRFLVADVTASSAA